MNLSKYNIHSTIAGTENGFMVNLLTGNADVFTPGELKKLENLRNGEEPDPEFMAELASKGYLISEEEEEMLYRTRYLDFLDSRDRDEVQLFFVPNYSCNFACSYCYQDDYTHDGQVLTYEVIDAFFAYIIREFAARRKYITVFGGEPLLNSFRQKELISSLLYQATALGVDVCFVTNGHALEEYMEILKKARIREIQVTLDGTADVHNGRRFLKGGGQTFDKIVKGIDACLAHNIPVNLRMVADRENLPDLPNLARFAIDRGWTDNPLFKTQLGRNYELHHCQASSGKLYNRLDLAAGIFTLTRENPHIAEFFKPAYSVARYLSENGTLPDPLFDSCPACKTEWAFDYTGQIYPCTATVGKSGESLGTFYPEVSLHPEKVEEWEDRDVTSIEECSTCNLQLACGGGCGSVAKNRTGTICSTDCRPVRELLELGFAACFTENDK